MSYRFIVYVAKQKTETRELKYDMIPGFSSFNEE